MRPGLSAVLGLVLAATLAWHSAPATAQQAGDSPQRSREARTADACSAAEMRRIVRDAGGTVDEREAKVMSDWCRQWETRDRIATTTIAAAKPPAPSPTTPVRIDRIGTNPPEPAIWCTKTFCSCFKGKKYDGCVDTQVHCQGGALKCGPLGHVCACKIP